MAFKRELLAILACPKCRGEIRLTEKEDGLVCDTCSLLYAIRDGIPVMSIDKAQQLNP